MGKAVKSITGALGFSSDTNAGSGAMQASIDTMRDVLKRIDKIDLPDQEKLKMKFELQKIFMPEEGEKVDVSKVKQMLSEVPGGEDIMNEVQTQYAELASQGGLGPEERNIFDQLQTEAGKSVQAQYETIDRQMAERGTESSGLAAALKAGAIQGQADRSFKGARDLAAQAAAAKRDVLAQRAGLGGQLAAAQSDRQRAVAGAELTGEQARAGFETSKREALQAQEAERVGKSTQQQTYDTGLERERFSNEMQKAQGSLGAAGGISQGLANQGAAQAAAEQQNAAGRRALVGAGISAFASDINLKKDVKHGEGSIRDLLDKLEPYEYKYKDDKYGEGNQIGVMAQDLEKSEEGDKYVIDTPEGKMVDYGKMGPTMMASLADMHKRLKEVEEHSEDDNEYEFKDGGLKQKALGSMVSSKPNNGYTPSVDARDQIAQFNALNGRKYSEGSKFNRNNASNEEVARMDRMFAGDDSQNELDKQTLDFNKNISQGNNYNQTENNVYKSQLGRDNELGNKLKAVAGALDYQDPSQARLGSITDAIGQYKAYANGGIGETINPLEDHEQVKLEEDTLGGLMPGDDEPLSQLKDQMKSLEEFDPEEVQRAIASQVEEIVNSAPEEDRPQLEEQLRNMMDVMSNMNQEPQPQQAPPQVGEVPQQYNNGGMAYEDGGEGTIIPGDSYAGDELPDRINSGEAVLNVDMQQNLLDKLKELKQKRTDEMLDDGELEVNPKAQQKLIDISRGDADVEDIQEDDNIIESRGLKKLLGMLGRK